VGWRAQDAWEGQQAMEYLGSHNAMEYLGSHNAMINVYKFLQKGIV